MKYNICEEHEDKTIIFYDWGWACPLCEAENKIKELEKKINDLNEEDEVKRITQLWNTLNDTCKQWEKMFAEREEKDA